MAPSQPELRSVPGHPDPRSVAPGKTEPSLMMSDGDLVAVYHPMMRETQQHCVIHGSCPSLFVFVRVVNLPVLRAPHATGEPAIPISRYHGFGLFWAEKALLARNV